MTPDRADLAVRTIRIPVPASGYSLVVAIPLDDSDLSSENWSRVVARASTLARQALEDLTVQPNLI